MESKNPEWLEILDKLHDLHSNNFNEGGLATFLLGAKKCYALISERNELQTESLMLDSYEKGYRACKDKMKPRPISQYDKEAGEDVLLYCSDGYFCLETIGGWYEGKWETPSDEEIPIPPLFFCPIQDWPREGGLK